jgi:hypothetical protein
MGLYSISSCSKESANVCQDGPCNVVAPIGGYDYPIRPGTPEWGTLKTNLEMLDACQIPLDSLANISSARLVETCLDFPLLFDLFLNVGVNITGRLKEQMNTFSGFIELQKRVDAPGLMLQKYAQMHPACISALGTNREKGDYTLFFTSFEMIISYDSILIKLTKNERKSLLHAAIEKYYCKRSQRNDYGYYDFATSLFIVARIMMIDHFEPFEQQISSNGDLELFVSKLLWPMNSFERTEKIHQIILENANQFYN